MQPFPSLLVHIDNWRYRGPQCLILCCALALVTQAGCKAAGSVSYIDLKFKRLGTGGPLVPTTEIDHAVWSQDANRNEWLQVALSRHRDGFTALDRERFDLSLLLPGMPAGKGREYRVTKETLRAYSRKGVSHVRFASLGGIVGVWWEKNQTLAGRFRLRAKKQIFHILTGWVDAGPVIMAGEFNARRNDEMVERIIATSEEDGMERSIGVDSPAIQYGQPVKVTGPPVESGGD